MVFPSYGQRTRQCPHFERDREFADSPLEEAGFEPSVPLTRPILRPSRRTSFLGGTESSRTRCWREQDSNSRSRRERNGRWEARHISFRAQLYELGARQSRERPKSSNPSPSRPPAGSPVRTWLFGAKPINSRRANRVATARLSRSLGARRGHRRARNTADRFGDAQAAQLSTRSSRTDARR